MGGDRIASHLADLHGIQSELLVAIHFLTKEEQEDILKTAQPRMLGAREEEAFCQPGLLGSHQLFLPWH